MVVCRSFGCEATWRATARETEISVIGRWKFSTNLEA